MGLGDDLMITGIVEQEHIKHPDKQIVIGSLKRNLIYQEIILPGYILTPSHSVIKSSISAATSSGLSS